MYYKGGILVYYLCSSLIWPSVIFVKQVNVWYVFNDIDTHSVLTYIVMWLVDSMFRIAAPGYMCMPAITYIDPLSTCLSHDVLFFTHTVQYYRSVNVHDVWMKLAIYAFKEDQWPPMLFICVPLSGIRIIDHVLVFTMKL